MVFKWIAGLAMLLSSVVCHAEVQQISPNGFSVRHSANASATPAESWNEMVNHIDEWWSSEHTWSGSAENLYIKAEVGGCFCERLPQDGNHAGVEHLRIIYLKPGRELRFDGALGPLQTMALQGRMIWQIAATETGSSITFLYQVHGFLEGGFESLAPAVDGVIGEQLERLIQQLENP